MAAIVEDAGQNLSVLFPFVAQLPPPLRRSFVMKRKWHSRRRSQQGANHSSHVMCFVVFMGKWRYRLHKSLWISFQGLTSGSACKDTSRGGRQGGLGGKEGGRHQRNCEELKVGSQEMLTLSSCSAGGLGRERCRELCRSELSGKSLQVLEVLLYVGTNPCTSKDGFVDHARKKKTKKRKGMVGKKEKNIHRHTNQHTASTRKKNKGKENNKKKIKPKI